MSFKFVVDYVSLEIKAFKTFIYLFVNNNSHIRVWPFKLQELIKCELGFCGFIVVWSLMILWIMVIFMVLNM